MSRVQVALEQQLSRVADELGDLRLGVLRLAHMQLDGPSDLREATLEILAQVVNDPLTELAQLRLDAQADSPRSVTATS